MFSSVEKDRGRHVKAFTYIGDLPCVHTFTIVGNCVAFLPVIALCLECAIPSRQV